MIPTHATIGKTIASGIEKTKIATATVIAATDPDRDRLDETAATIVETGTGIGIAMLIRAKLGRMTGRGLGATRGKEETDVATGMNLLLKVCSTAMISEKPATNVSKA